jgi:hypothetical protein
MRIFASFNFLRPGKPQEIANKSLLKSLLITIFVRKEEQIVKNVDSKEWNDAIKAKMVKNGQ